MIHTLGHGANDRTTRTEQDTMSFSQKGMEAHGSLRSLCARGWGRNPSRRGAGALPINPGNMRKLALPARRLIRGFAWNLRHLTTDPACKLYREPKNRFARWRFERNRGSACLPCMRGRDFVRSAEILRRGVA